MGGIHRAPLKLVVVEEAVEVGGVVVHPAVQPQPQELEQGLKEEEEELEIQLLLLHQQVLPRHRVKDSDDLLR